MENFNTLEMLPSSSMSPRRRMELGVSELPTAYSSKVWKIDLKDATPHTASAFVGILTELQFISSAK